MPQQYELITATSAPRFSSIEQVDILTNYGTTGFGLYAIQYNDGRIYAYNKNENKVYQCLDNIVHKENERLFIEIENGKYDARPVMKIFFEKVVDFFKSALAYLSLGFYQCQQKQQLEDKLMDWIKIRDELVSLAKEAIGLLRGQQLDSIIQDGVEVGHRYREYCASSFQNIFLKVKPLPEDPIAIAYAPKADSELSLVNEIMGLVRWPIGTNHFIQDTLPHQILAQRIVKQAEREIEKEKTQAEMTKAEMTKPIGTIGSNAPPSDNKIVDVPYPSFDDL